MSTYQFPPDNQRCRMHDALDRRCPNKEVDSGFCSWHLLVAFAVCRNQIEYAYGKQESA